MKKCIFLLMILTLLLTGCTGSGKREETEVPEEATGEVLETDSDPVAASLPHDTLF